MNAAFRAIPLILALAVAPVASVIPFIASITPFICAVVPIATPVPPSTCQKMFLASAPPARVTFMPLDWVMSCAIWKIQTSFAPPEIVTSVAI